MSKEILPIAVDALGGDHAPEDVVRGALESGVPVILVGPEKQIRPILNESGSETVVDVVDVELSVGMDENPLAAVRNKKDSSMMRAIRMVKDGSAGGVMSAGNTGAFMMGATMILGRLPNVTRPAAAIPVPTPSGHCLLLDAGAATDCTAEDLLNFGIMGAAYVSAVWGVKDPKVGLLSIGEEEGKGSKAAKDAYRLLKATQLNFIGNVQGSDLVTKLADVIVTDGFTGNVALKAAEGISTLIMSVVKEELQATKGIQRVAAWVLYPLFNKIKKRLDWREYGGGGLLGVKGNVIIAHGKSKARAISSAVRLAGDLAQTEVLKRMEEALLAYGGQTAEG